MPNNVGLTALAEGNLQAEQLIIKMKEVLALANQSLANNKNPIVNTPNTLNSSVGNNAEQTAQIQKQAKAITELQQKYNALISTQARGTNSTNNNTKATRENSIANQILRNETDRNFLLRAILCLLLCIKSNGRRFADYIAATDA